MVAVVMPAHNEEEYLTASVTTVLDGLGGDGDPLRVIIVENGSTDDTIGVARKLAVDHPGIEVLSRPDADYGAALRAGILAADQDWVVIFDVDFVDLAFLADAREEAERTGAAIVVGTKRGPGSEDERSLQRKVITAGFSTLLRIGFGLRVSDTHGVKLLNRPVLADLVTACHSGKEMFDTELILRAERAGLTVRELPVRAADQRPPRSSILSRIPRTVRGLAHLRLALWQDPGDRHRDGPTGPTS